MERAEASDKTRAQVAKELGVGAPALSYWIYKLRAERSKAQTTGGLVPVRVISERPLEPERLELEVDGAVVRFAEGTSPQYVAQLAGELRRC